MVEKSVRTTIDEKLELRTSRVRVRTLNHSHPSRNESGHQHVVA